MEAWDVCLGRRDRKVGIHTCWEDHMKIDLAGREDSFKKFWLKKLEN